jgi:hypothetical protein
MSKRFAIGKMHEKKIILLLTWGESQAIKSV